MAWHLLRARRMRSSFLALSFFSSVFVLAASACGGRVEGIAGQPSGQAVGTSIPSQSSSSGGSSSGSTTCGAVPFCDDGDVKVGSEDDCAEGTSCYPRSECGQTIWCSGRGGQCDGIPVCPPNTTEVASCPTDADCTSETVCGTTIYCLASCESPMPICDDGDTQVVSPGQCLQDDAVCYSRSACTMTIWCTGPAK